MKVLICGGAGYIGSQVLLTLQSCGYECHVLDNLSTGHKWACKSAPHCELDLMQRAALLTYFSHHRFDAVCHLAARSVLSESESNPAKYYLNNVSGTINLLDAMIATNVKKLIFSSTAAVYEISDTIPRHEHHPTKPGSPYGKSKLFVEQIIHDYARAFDLDAIIFRYFNAAGASTDPLLGEFHEPETHLIPNVLNSVLQSIPLSVYGADYETRDGTCIRDYVHVSDIACAHKAGLQYISENSGCHIFNLGNSRGYSVREILSVCQEVSGQAIQFEQLGRRPGDVPVLIADSSKARKLLRWQPQLEDITHIVKTAWQWHKHCHEHPPA